MYVQAVEFTRRETAEWKCDMVIFPEAAVEHPPQCFNQGELSFRNVALDVLSKLARELNIHIVLGSVVADRKEDKAYCEKCIVLTPKGGMTSIRKNTSTAPRHEVATFNTEEGVVGVLIGAEAEDSERWAQILSRRPCLVINPTRAPVQMDLDLAKIHPELQVVAWMNAMKAVVHYVEAQTRRWPVAFVRADAPMQAGGAGTSLVFEPHRSVFASSWNPLFVAVDTTHPSMMRKRRMPGFRELNIEARLRAAQRDQGILMDEQAELGPRYDVWSFMVESRVSKALLGNSLVKSWKLVMVEEAAKKEAQKYEFTSTMLPLTTITGRTVYAVATTIGSLVMWDPVMKRELSSFELKQGAISCMAQGRNSMEYFTLGRTEEDLTFRHFEDLQLLASAVIPQSALPWANWRKIAPAEDDLTSCSSHSSSEQYDTDRPSRGYVQMVAVPTSSFYATVTSAFYLDQPHHILAVLEVRGLAPIGLVVDVCGGAAQAVDIYGSGPPPTSRENNDLEDDDDEAEDLMGPTSSVEPLEYLVGTESVEQHFQENHPSQPNRVVVFLYNTNRLIILVLETWEIHEQMLLEERPTRRQTEDVPLALAVVDSSVQGSFNIIVSYRSQILRWWQVSLSGCRQVALVPVHLPINILSVIELPLPTGVQAWKWDPDEFPIQSRTRSKSKASVVKGLTKRMDTKRFTEITTRRSSIQGPAKATSIVAVAFNQSPKVRYSTISGDKAQGQNLSSADTARTETAIALTAGAEGSMLFPSGNLFIAAIDSKRGMPLFIGRAGRIVELYNISLDGAICCSKPQGVFEPKRKSADFVERMDTCPTDLWCLDKAIVCICRCGDVRHIEITLEDEAVALADIPATFGID